MNGSNKLASRCKNIALAHLLTIWDAILGGNSKDC